MKDYSKPDSDLAFLADEAMDFIEDSVTSRGGEVREMFVSVITSEGFDPDSASCGRGIESPTELVLWHLAQAEQIANAIGMPIQFLPIKPIGQG